MAVRRIAARFVYTLESPEPLRNGFVEYDDSDGTILGTGICTDDTDIQEGALVPGFVNAHCHVELSHLHGKFYKGSGMAGFIDQINALRDWAGRDVKEQLVRKWMDKMWDDGVSAMADISNDDSSFDVDSSLDDVSFSIDVVSLVDVSLIFDVEDSSKKLESLLELEFCCSSLLESKDSKLLYESSIDTLGSLPLFSLLFTITGINEAKIIIIVISDTIIVIFNTFLFLLFC